MKRKTVILYPCTLLVFALACGSIMRGSAGDVDYLLRQAEKDIVKANSVEDIKRKKILLDNSYMRLREAEEICKKKKLSPYRFYNIFALYYLFKGEYIQAKNYASLSKRKNPQGGYAYVIEYRVLLKEKGRSNVNEAIAGVLKAKKLSPGMLLADLTLGDCYFLKGDFSKARQYYKKVLMANREYQVESADRLETIFQIESVKLSPGQIKGILFSKGVKRDNVANLLDKEFAVSKYIRGTSGRQSSFKDISGSIYAKSIIKLHSQGLFSYIKGDKFLPFTIMNRGELAKLIEDFLIIATGNTGYRSRYKKSDKSPIKDVKSEHPYYNAIRVVLDKNIMDLTLSGSFNPDEPVNGFNAIFTLNRMIKNYRRR